jgi:hypothetical protein
MNESKTPSISDPVKIELIHSIKDILIHLIDVAFQREKED